MNQWISECNRLLAEGRLDQAAAWLRQWLGQHPRDAEALRQLARIAYHQGAFDLGLSHLEQAALLTPDAPGLWYELGVLALAAGRPSVAETAFRRELELTPDHPDAAFNLTFSLRQLKRDPEALALLEQIVRAHPGFGKAWFNLANLRNEHGLHQAAEAAYRQALATGFDHPSVRTALAGVLIKLERCEEVVPILAPVVSADPMEHAAANNLAIALTALGRLEQALPLFELLRRNHPDNVRYRINHCVALSKLGRNAEALAGAEAAVELAPELAEAWINLAEARLKDNDPDGAQAACRRALELAPQSHVALYTLANALLMSGGNPEAIAAYRQALALEPDNAALHSALLVAMAHTGGLDPAEVFAEHVRYGQRQEARVVPLVLPSRRDHDPERRLKIGYLSPEFGSQAATLYFQPILELHDRSQVELFGYHVRPQTDPQARAQAALMDHWRPLASGSDRQAAEQIRQDGIDILVDLGGHTPYNRLPIFAWKPAPIQTTWFGYPLTTGLRRIDYRLTPLVFPLPGSVEESYFTETLWRAEIGPPFQPPRLRARPTQPPLTITGRPRFGSFNKVAKIGPEVVALWGQILHDLPAATLLVVVPGGASSQAAARLRQAFAVHGVAGERLVFEDLRSLDGFLELVASVDVALDPFPYSGGSTTLLTLWMGVPVVTLRLETPSSSWGAVNMWAWGEGLVADCTADYRRLAVALIGDPPWLARLRHTIPQTMAAGLTEKNRNEVRHLEATYRQWFRDLVARQRQTG